MQLQYLFITHSHWDRIEGLQEFCSRYPVKSYAGRSEASAVNNLLEGGETIKVGKLTFHTLPIPGHSPQGIAFYVQGCVFTSDALFCASVGGTSSPKEARCQVDHIRKHIFTLPEETLLFPAHGPMSTLGVEKYTNPFCL